MAGVAQVAGLLRDAQGLETLAIAAALFYAVWISVTFYSDVAGPKARTPSVLAAMVLLGTMAAAIPGAGTQQAHTAAFVIAYLAARFVAAGAIQASGAMVVDWPAAQAFMGLVPWLASIWVPGPWRYALWGLGIALDLYGSMRSRGTKEEWAQAMAERLADSSPRGKRRWGRRVSGERAAQFDARRETQIGSEASTDTGTATRGGRRRRSRRVSPTLPRVAELDVEHVTERLGLFLVIVLGEAVAEIVLGVSRLQTWTLATGWVRSPVSSSWW